MKLLYEIGMEYPNKDSKRKRKYCMYECSDCKKPVKMQYDNAKRTDICKSCAMRISKTTHGHSGERLYSIWRGIIDRCTNTTCKTYQHYGARGITVETTWKDSYIIFKEWALSNGYASNLTIDRIDTTKGYYPNNCRWATKTLQSRNIIPICSTNTSGYKGAVWHKQSKKWIARITVNYKNISLGSYTEKIEAAKAYDTYVFLNNLEHSTNSLDLFSEVSYE